MRKKMFAFFDFLRSMNLNVLLITERNLGSHAELQGNEGFLADAVINLGMDHRNGKLVRTMQIEKMRHVRHAMEKQAVDVGPHGLVVLGPLFDWIKYEIDRSQVDVRFGAYEEYVGFLSKENSTTIFADKGDFFPAC